MSKENTVEEQDQNTPVDNNSANDEPKEWLVTLLLSFFSGSIRNS